MTKFKEDHLQIQVADYLRLQYPKVFWFHPANERKASPQAGARLKRKGVLKGLPDIWIMETRFPKRLKAALGLIIELKINPNKPSPEQIQVMKQLQERGYITFVCYSFDQAKELIDSYLK